jgi:hypothetical protein
MKPDNADGSDGRSLNSHAAYASSLTASGAPASEPLLATF